MAEHHIEVSRNLRYFDNEKPDQPELLMALHGYTQHPKFFQRKFNVLDDRAYVVAPEGLHRFYIQGHSGRVGASWMTKEDRLIDIADNMNYLDQLYLRLLMRNYERKTLLGFSQGAATAVRFFCHQPSYFDRLVLWAGSFPPDLDLPSNAEALNQTGIDLVIGDDDEFIKEDHIVELSKIFDAHQIKYRLHRFSGGHDIDSSTLSGLFR
ncbi:alpha/beta hydrolase [Sanyastnella coralliicola]|uniref:alpha/beta hydrolase n=1 Tax=Sanyastnella coralliicola TaxID=3069118 RepID=UPI0027BA9CC9|nr:dienelactone hydrolase family protein [Longitalea sp. SCSIO 12813]